MTHISLEEYRMLKDKQAIKTAKRLKYGNVPTTIDNIKFASKTEAKRYEVLKTLQLAGEIYCLELQPEFQFPCGIKYKADISYLLNGKKVVEDCKGFSTRIFLMKEKMLKYHCPDLDFRIIK